MTKTEQNYAVAYFCGYRWLETEYVGKSACLAEERRRVTFAHPAELGERIIIREWTEAEALHDGLPSRQGWHAPDYTADRDAIVGAIERLSSDEQIQFVARLYAVVFGNECPIAEFWDGLVDVPALLLAKPAQLCEALCRTLHPERWPTAS